MLLEGRPLWLTWVGRDEQLRILPLDDTGSPGGLASTEDSMSEARPLAVMPSTSRPHPGEAGALRSAASPSRLLLARPGDPAGPLFTVECAPAVPREGP